MSLDEFKMKKEYYLNDSYLKEMPNDLLVELLINLGFKFVEQHYIDFKSDNIDKIKVLESLIEK